MPAILCLYWFYRVCSRVYAGLSSITDGRGVWMPTLFVTIPTNNSDTSRAMRTCLLAFAHSPLLILNVLRVFMELRLCCVVGYLFLPFCSYTCY